jgi:3-methylfumaryl-CoA hydratase
MSALASAGTAWIGRTETATDTITPAMVEAYAATLGTTADATPGAAAPQGAHWMLAPPRAAMGELGADGHPRRGGFLPPIELPRRMWAASEVSFLAPLAIGEAIERTATVTGIEEKRGTSGPLVFVTVEHVYRAAGVVAIEETQTIVYRDVQPYVRPPASAEAGEPADFERRLAPDPVMLFRYSAITFNGHRIHYDQPYATRVELYPGIVVHAPLSASLCLDLAAREIGPNRLKRFGFRGVSPAFANETIRIAARREGDTVAFTVSSEGRIVVRAKAEAG